ncbi:MAG: FeoA family protein [Lachnospiraceae bacterium]|jgi:ferrous iron transport protein A
MPIALAEIGLPFVISRISGAESVRHHLTELGFIPGSTVTVVANNGGNLIVKVKDARVAIDRGLAMKVFS